MQLQGNLREFNLPNILQLVKMSAKSGALTIRREEEWGRIYFHDGTICYAFSDPQALPLGERLVRLGAITAAQLNEALAAQKKEGEGARIGAVMLSSGLIDAGTLEHAVREQIQDTAFTFFSWPDGDFAFEADETVEGEDILVAMTVETVIMEGCRRIDEWEFIFEQLGSLERVPHLASGTRADQGESLTLTAEEWHVIVRIDGHADINTVLRDSGLDRFNGAKVMYGLYSSGLITVRDPVIDSIGSTTSVAVRGAIDLYNEVFLNTLTDGNLVKQLRVEVIDDKEVEIPILAGQLPLGAGDDEDEAGFAGEELLAFTASAASPETAWRRLAAEATAWVIMANANDRDSLRSTQADLEFVRSLGEAPYVIAAYMSMSGDELSPKQIAKAIGVGSSVPVIPCHLRDRATVVDVVRTALGLGTKDDED